jgi:CRISPR system Cascade subunit CasC
MTTFIQLHLLTSYPPSNLNRDDLGRPKTAKMGGVDRLRISSQSLKRAWRTSALFEEALAGHIGTRTKRLGIEVYKQLEQGGISPKLAEKWAQMIANVFGKPKKENPNKPEKLEHLEIEQLVHISPVEQENINKLVATIIATEKEPSQEDLNLLSQQRQAVDIALFGRMLADAPAHNTEAAVQVAHAISVHPVAIEDDYFTAVDDLNNKNINTGSAHIGETGFAAALFYTYICIDRDLLTKHLEENQSLVNKTIAALTEAAIKVSPNGKQNSFGSRAYASYVLAEIGHQQPRSLSVAFLKPIMGYDYPEHSIEVLKNHKQSIEAVYGPCSKNSYELNAFKGHGKFNELLDFVTT